MLKKLTLLTLLILLFGCVSKRSYLRPNPGTCIKMDSSDYAVFVIKPLNKNNYLGLTFNYYGDIAHLFGLGEDSFGKSYHSYVDCPKFSRISSSAKAALIRRKELDLVRKLIKEIK